METMDPRERANLGVPDAEDSRWNEIWQLVLSAERRPAADRRDFILRAHADSFVTRQVIAILEGSASMASYASGAPSMSVPGEDRFTPQAGMTIGRYRVGTLLGSGATGSVHAGFDEELNRAVAIKFFPFRHDADAGGKAVPVREARAASALNHPNIIMIHEVIETGYGAAIVMELVPGVTLRALVGTGPPISDVLQWSGQLAAALAVAHASDLIHGDIKPENVMVRPDGYVKLLDFGLSLGALPDGRTATTLTGTPRYLSPEQCLGQRPTAASDMFAFGVMLYELTTGQYPFESQGMLGVLQSIAGADPRRPASLNRKLSRPFERLILEMLAKRPGERPTAQQVAEGLAGMARNSNAARALFGVKGRWWAMGVLVVAAAGLSVVSRQPGGRLDLSRMSVRPIASQAGLEAAPSISPDGLWISSLYRARATDRAQFRVRSTQGGEPTVIETRGIDVEDPAAWSPDSSELAFVGSHSGKQFIYRTSRAGGSISRITECNNGPRSCGVDWSPDGHLLAVSDVLPGQTAAGLFLVDVANGRRRALIPPGGRWVSRPRFSADGKWIALKWQASFTKDEICLISAQGGAVRCVTRGPRWVNSFGWSSDGRSLFAISAPRDDKPEMWQFPLDAASEPYRVASFDIGRARDLSIASHTGSLVWIRDLSTSSLSRMQTEKTGGTAEPLVSSSGSDTDAEWSSNGRMVFRSDRSGWNEIWVARADGSEQRQATRFAGPFVGDPHWSPDGRSLAFTAHSDGNADILTMACDQEGPQACGNPRQLTREPATDANPTWSADGRWIYFSSNRSGRFEVWKAPAVGGEPVQITWNGGYLARESADGKWLYYSKVMQGEGFWRISLPARGTEQQEELVTHGHFRSAATWVLGLRELFYYPSEQDGVLPFLSVRAVDLETGRKRDLPTGNVLLGRGLSLSPDGKWLLRTQSDRSQSVIMIAERPAAQ